MATTGETPTVKQAAIQNNFTSDRAMQA